VTRRHRPQHVRRQRLDAAYADHRLLYIQGILRGGGDTRFLLIADSSLVWFVSLPLGALAGLVWHMSPAWIYFFLRWSTRKGLVCLIRFLTGKWIKVIARVKSGKHKKFRRPHLRTGNLLL
jgi:hypothetical protein